MNGLTLDAGALIALDRPASRARVMLRVAEAIRRGATICVPAPVITQAWRGRRQVTLAQLLKRDDVEIVALDGTIARAVGVLSGQTGHSDIVDLHVALCARERGHAVVTTDPDDLAAIDPGLTLITV